MMDNNQYWKLMWHLRYVESLIENVADATAQENYCECPICKAKFPAFLPFSVPPLLPHPNSRCPNCGSLKRHRKLYLLMQKLDWHREGMRILHFAPERTLFYFFNTFQDIDYWPVDLNPKMYGVRKAVDITDITFDDDSFDLIMCTHVLEHIPDDRKAMSELYRVLKPKTGIAFLNVPIFNNPTTLENPEYNTPELRRKYYGQADHVRAYGFDYPDRLRAAGFNVRLFEDIDDKDLKRYGINKNEQIFWCRKE